MKKLWLTYAWKDNEDRDIDYIIQEIDRIENVETCFDRRSLIPGQRLWQQIGGIITDPNECDAWGIVLTKNSINSEACIEELSYALERALRSNGEDFPFFALLHNVDAKELPPALKIRLFIRLSEENFADQVAAAVEKRAPGYIPKDLQKWFQTYHHETDSGLTVLELRPRFERISPFGVCVDLEEKKSGNVVKASFGPINRIPKGHVAFNWIDSETTLTDGTRVWVWGADNEINSTTSIYLFFNHIPKRIWFGHQKNLNLIKIDDKFTMSS